MTEKNNFGTVKFPHRMYYKYKSASDYPVVLFSLWSEQARHSCCEELDRKGIFYSFVSECEIYVLGDFEVVRPILDRHNDYDTAPEAQEFRLSMGLA